jgi:beta-1,4-mannosyl-glycoprotein beta-1,4-N-acetylglucosaminyltransferase
MKSFDCFTYFNESEIIKLRFDELRDVVDYFVVVEAAETFTGEPKPLYFDDLDLDEALLKKIIRINNPFPSKDMSSWDREIFQRNQIAEVLNYADPNDLVVISDADEIPNWQAVISISNFPVQLDVRQYFWNYHWQVPDHCNQGARPVVALAKDLVDNTPQELRAMTLDRIPNGGWHFSFFGEEDKIRYKIESFAHTEYDEDKYKSAEKILFRVRNGVDPFDRFPLKYKEIDNTYPRSLQSL